MVKYIIVHCKHDGCNEYKAYEDPDTQKRYTPIQINPPKLFVFDNKEQAKIFFEDYLSDIDDTDIRCKKGIDIEHVEHCSCGVVDLNDEDEPVLFYNKTNQIFLTEVGAQVFETSLNSTYNNKNINLTNKHIRKFKTLSQEQRERYVELGKICQDCKNNDV
jgi:hypothetical protein